MIEYLKLSAEALLLTIAIEVATVWLLGLRSKPQLLTVVLINVITNPALNFIVLLNSFLGWIDQNTVLIIFLEVAVVVIEWKLLVYALRLKSGTMFLLSLVINTASSLAGLFIFWR